MWCAIRSIFTNLSHLSFWSLPCSNIGETASVFEAVHGTAPDIAGQNKANPTALLLSGVMMLKHLGLQAHGLAIEAACLDVIREGKYRTGDLGGRASTTDFAKAIVDKVDVAAHSGAAAAAVGATGTTTSSSKKHASSTL